MWCDRVAWQRVGGLLGFVLTSVVAITPAAVEAENEVSSAEVPVALARSTDKGAVACVSPAAAEVGRAILQRGGNAVDAAVAVAFALAVSWPEAGNIGGGGFMLVAPPGQAVTCFEFRETAPRAASVDLLADGSVTAWDVRAAGVPGTVRGLALAHARFGTLPWRELIAPAIDLAERGVLVNAALARSLNRVLEDKRTTQPEFRRLFQAPNGRRWQEGDRLVQRDLARTLLRIAQDGPDAFYTGSIAQLIVQEMRRSGGLITADDLKAYRPQERVPIAIRYRDWEVYAPPPPSSGGITLALMLQMLEALDWKSQGRWSAETYHYLIEVMRRAYADRARHLGDPDFTRIPPHLTSKEYARRLAAGIRRDKATPSAEVAPDLEIRPEGESTTHFSIIDRNGLAVSTTYTLENSYGCRMAIGGAGFILNNEMTDFNPRPGITTVGGLIGTPPNQIAPGKRMLSSMTPTIVRQRGQTVLITGSPGGRTIINTVLCVLLNHLDFGMSAEQSVAAPRLHHQWLPDVARLEPLPPGHDELPAQLRRKGHHLVFGRQGDAHSIFVDPQTGRRTVVADRRIDGAIGLE
ncbi:MAG: gamma-glutamyltransferase [Gemmataceae bacterium]|nr:gamma-glutamyltransferase [Gemmataceae bacterium]